MILQKYCLKNMLIYLEWKEETRLLNWMRQNAVTVLETNQIPNQS